MANTSSENEPQIIIFSKIYRGLKYFYFLRKKVETINHRNNFRVEPILVPKHKKIIWTNCVNVIIFRFLSYFSLFSFFNKNI